MSHPVSDPEGAGTRLLVTAGPTHEPIDAVRFLGNRSSGRLGIALADAAAGRGWSVDLLLGPTCQQPSDSRVRVARFRTAEELRELLGERFGGCDVLVMAAAVADYRPRTRASGSAEKLRRSEQGLTLDLEPTPDLLVEVSARRRPGQFVVGFALEPRDRLLASARDKLERKGLDLIVANPLETMDAGEIEATLIGGPGAGLGEEPVAWDRMAKELFAERLLDRIEARRLD